MVCSSTSSYANAVINKGASRKGGSLKSLNIFGLKRRRCFRPFDAMVLAVACEDALIIWRLNPKALTNRCVIFACQQVYPLNKFLFLHFCDTLFEKFL